MLKKNKKNFGNNYRVAMLSKTYLTITGIILSNLKSIGQS